MKNQIQEVLKKYPDAQRENLIPILQDIQEGTGWLSEEAVNTVSEYLQLPTSKIFGVATFYNQFRFQPTGKYHIQICRGTACHVLGSANVLQELEKHLGIKTDETTKDGLFSIEVVACIGACGLAPVISVNGKFHAKVTGESIKAIVEDYRNKENL